MFIDSSTYFNDLEKITVTAFLDTGNKLIDPYNQRPIILINKSLININDKKILLVPYNTVNNSDLLKCVIPKKIYIHNIGYRKRRHGVLWSSVYLYMGSGAQPRRHAAQKQNC